jgi:hypothetical protein
METIAIEKVSKDDRRFCISYPLTDSLLSASIERYGILSPCLLIDLPPLIVVTGHRRIEAATLLRLPRVPCVVLTIGEREALLTAINDNLKRGLNSVEKAYCVEKMSRLGFSHPEIFEVMRLVGLQPHEKTMRLCRAIASSDEQTRNFLVDHSLTVNGAELLFDFDARERHRIITLLAPLRLTVSHIREVLQSMRLLKVRENDLDFDFLSGAGSTEELKKRLKRKTRPLLASYEEELARVVGESSLPGGLSIRVDPSFEKEQVDIFVKLSNDQEAADFSAKLQGMVKNGYFRRLFELTRGLLHRN